ncbi:alpha/beta fold hydrolase [Emcibacter sp.]|uniref:alpha/beta fold hydrolase n=1 Tax=Emcibacter sp. TaxID=1979954 RepID=UPI003A8DFCAD
MEAIETICDVSINGETVQIEITGTGPTVLLLHGWSMDRRMWRPQIAALSKTYRVVAVDRRGFGKSSAPPDLDKEPEDINALLDFLDCDDCALVGMSQGGRIALRFAHKYPEKLWGLVLQGAPLDGFPPPDNDKELIPISLYSSLVSTGETVQMKKLWREHPLMQCEDPSSQSLIEKILDEYEARDLLAQKENSGSPSPSLAPVLDTIKVPTLIINGERDTDWLLQVANALDHGLPNSEYLVISGAGHFSNLSHPGEFNEAVLSFLRSCQKEKS